MEDFKIWLSVILYIACNTWPLLVIFGAWFLYYCIVYVNTTSSRLDAYLEKKDRENRRIKEEEKKKDKEEKIHKLMCMITKGTYIWVDRDFELDLFGLMNLYRVIDFDFKNKSITAKSEWYSGTSFGSITDEFNLCDIYPQIRIATKDEVLRCKKDKKELKDKLDAEEAKTKKNQYGAFKDRPW